MEKFTHLEALLFAAVLENCVDQLSILGYIMPVSYEGKTDISHVCASILPLERNLSWFSSCLGFMSSTPMKYSCILFLPGRQYARDVITVTMKKVQESGKFNSLTEANEREKAKKSKFHDFLIRSVLHSVLSCLTAQSRNNMIAYLRDELQEMRTKMNMESRYMKKSTDLQIHQTQKKCSNAENVLDKEIQKLRTRTDEEIRVHTEIENFLRQHHKVEEKLEYWADKYENDMDAKTEELDALKAAKANNLEMLQRLAEEVRRQQHLRAHPCKTGFFLPSFRYRTRTMEEKITTFAIWIRERSNKGHGGGRSLLTHFPWAAQELLNAQSGDPHCDPRAGAAPTVL
uniref:IQ motif containing G n=1 Tax=Athene cunicularia TaxID=194338 RepID=A0A663MZR1_ATHCN